METSYSLSLNHLRKCGIGPRIVKREVKEEASQSLPPKQFLKKKKKTRWAVDNVKNYPRFHCLVGKQQPWP